MRKKTLSVIGLVALGIALFTAICLLAARLASMMGVEAALAATHTINCFHFINVIVYIAFLIGNCLKRENILWLGRSQTAYRRRLGHLVAD